MALPLTNLTLHCDASDTDKLFTTWDSSGGVHSGTPGDGDLVRVWDDEGDGVSDVMMLFGTSILFNCPNFRSGTPLMKHSCLDFGDDDGAFDWMVSNNQIGSAAKVASTFLGTSAKSIAIAFYPEAIVDTNASISDCEGVIAAGENFGLTLRDDSGTKRIYAFNNSGGLQTCNLALSTGQSYVAVVTHDGSTVQLSLTSNAGELTTSVSSGATDALSNPLTIGLAGTTFLDGRIGEFATWNAALTGTDLTDAKSYFVDKWLTVPPPGPKRIRRLPGDLELGLGCLLSPAIWRWQRMRKRVR